MFSTTIQTLWSRRRRLLATSVAVVLGVAFLAATLVLGDTTRAGFRGAFTDANANVDLVVRSSTRLGPAEYREIGTIDAALVDSIGALDGVAAAAPEVSGTARVIGADGETVGGDGPPQLGINWVEAGGLGMLELVDGRAPRALAPGRQPESERPVEVVLDRATAAAGGLTIGSTTTVYLPQPRQVTVVGLATVAGGESLGGATFTAFATPVAQTLLLGADDQVGGVRIAIDEAADAAAVTAAIDALLPADAEVITGAQQTDEDLRDIDESFLSMFRTLLVVFAGIAVVVAVFSIQNTFTILVAQRSRESALLRAVGAGRGQVLRGVLVEAFAVGVVATALGLLAGVGIAAGLHRLMVSSLDMPGAALVVSGATVAVVAAVGIGVTVLAALLPAVKASRVAPLAALREVEVDRSGLSKSRVVSGVLLVLGGVAAVIVAALGSGAALGLAGAGAAAVVVGMVVFGPVAAVPAAALLGAVPSATRAVPGRLARRNAMRNPRRTAASAAALLVGTAVVALFATFGATLKSSLDRAVEENFGGDFVIVGPSFDIQPMSPGLPAQVAAVPSVDDAVGVSFAMAEIDGRVTDVAGADPARLDRVFALDPVGPARALDADELAVSTDYADDHGLAVGSTVTLRWADGTTEQRAVALLFANDAMFSQVFVAPESVAAHAAQPSVGVILVDLVDGADVETAKAAVTAVTSADGAPAPIDQQQYLALVAGQVDQLLFIVYGMLGVAVVIAVLGIANTLALAIHERRREIGTLRAIGLDRRGVRTSVRWESVIVAIFGAVGGVAAGAFLGWGIVMALGDEMLSAVSFPLSTLAVIVGLAAVAGVVAAIRPARRAARLDVLDALATA